MSSPCLFWARPEDPDSHCESQCKLFISDVQKQECNYVIFFEKWFLAIFSVHHLWLCWWFIIKENQPSTWKCIWSLSLAPAGGGSSYYVCSTRFFTFTLKLMSPLIVYLHLMTTYSIPDSQHYFPGFASKKDMAGCAGNDHFSFLDWHH